MKGALRVALLFFSAMRIQKWLFGAGALIIIVGYLMQVPPFGAPVLLGLVIALVPSLFAGGLLLRYFVSPRRVLLIPYARQQVLGGMVIAVVAIATAGTLAAWVLGFGADVLPLIWLRIAAPVSVVLLSQFALIASPAGMAAWFTGLIALSQAMMIAGGREFLLKMGNNPGLPGGIIVITWAAFAFWFLRARSFKAPSDVSTPRTPALKEVSATRTTALRAFLFGNPSQAYQVWGGFLAAVFVAVLWGFLFKVMSRGSFADSVTRAIGAALGLGAWAGMGGFLVVRRSKSLWLRGGLDRVGVFRICEALAWKSFGAKAVSVLAMLLVAWVIEPSLGVNYTVLLAFNFCAGACLLYYGLMHVRGWRAVDILCGIVLFSVWVMTFATTQLVLGKPWLMPALVVAMLTAAFVLRQVALHRWKRIDWLVCKPPRAPARDEVRLAH